MTEKIIAFTSGGGSTDEVPITVQGDSMGTIKEGDWCTIEINNEETLSKYIVAGTTNNLIARNEEEENNQAYYDFYRSRTTIEDLNKGHTLKSRTRKTAYLNGTFTVKNILEKVVGEKPRALSRLPRPIPSDEIVKGFGKFMEHLKDLNDMTKYMKFGHLLSKSDGKNIDNFVGIPNFKKSSKHFGLFADTGNGKSSVFGYLINKLLATTISLLVIDPKSEFFNGSLISTKNLVSKAKEAGRKVYNISIFNNIYFKGSEENFKKLLKALSVFTETNFIRFSTGQNKNAFLLKFTEIVFRDIPDICEYSFTENDVIRILQEFTDESIATSVYRTENPRTTFINEVAAFCKNSVKVGFVTKNLNTLLNCLKKDSSKFSIEDIVRNIFLLQQGGKVPLIFINFSSKDKLQGWIQENFMNFVLSEITSVMNETLQDPDIEKVDALFCVDEANKYFPSENPSHNSFIETSIKSLNDILNHWGRSKGFGVALACPDPTQLDSQILGRIKKKCLFLGYGLKSSFLNDISSRTDISDAKELEKIDPLVEDENGLFESCQFFMVGMKSLLDKSGKGMVIELTKKELEE